MVVPGEGVPLGKPSQSRFGIREDAFPHWDHHSTVRYRNFRMSSTGLGKLIHRDSGTKQNTTMLASCYSLTALAEMILNNYRGLITIENPKRLPDFQSLVEESSSTFFNFKHSNLWNLSTAQAGWSSKRLRISLQLRARSCIHKQWPITQHNIKHDFTIKLHNKHA